MPEGIRVDPNITEGHPGYEESGQSEIIPTGMVKAESPRGVKPMGIASVVFGLLGGVFYWWTPLGMVLSLSGLIIGVVAWLSAAPRTTIRRLAIGGTILSAAAFVLDLVIALLGLELVQFGPLR
jgi:hypothetical protein